MESKTVYTEWNPKDKAGPLSTLFFAWSWRLMLKGAKTELELPDLYFPPRNNKSGGLANRLNKSWERELTKLKQEDTASIETDEAKSKKKNGPSLWAALLWTFRKEFAFIGILAGFNYLILNPSTAYMQAYVISYFDRGGSGIRFSKNKALIYAGAMLSMVFLTTFIVHQGTQLQFQLAMRLRIACSSLIYKKILRLSKSALTQTTSSHVVNLLSNDLQRFDQFCDFVNFIWISPLQMILIGSLMWTRIGLVTFVGIGALIILSFPIHSITVKVMRTLRQQIARLTDERVQLMQELIAGIQVIKMYAWEKPFSDIINTVRRKEIMRIRKSAYIYAVYLANVVLTARIVLYTTIVFTVLNGDELRSDTAFTLSNYFEMLQLTVAFFFPLAMIHLSETRVTIDRIQKFLLLDEQCQGTSQDRAVQNGSSRLQKTIQKTNNRWADESLELKNGRKNAPVTRIDDTTPVSVTLDRVYANWVPEQLPPTLSQVSMQIRSGELFAVVGCVGSGKSSILHLLLKELPLRAGTVQVSSGATGNVDSTTHGFIVDKPNLTISYASQEPWLFSGTVRDNILFGQQYDNARYVAVTKACALTKDFQQLPHGDMTSVGENGSALSGGQRARVNLARAVYKQADIYLLDDPLSAVDAKVAKHLFQKCIQQYLRKKTRVLVTHQLQFIEHTESIAVVDRGMVKMQGSYNELSKSSAKFVSVIKDIKMSVEATRQKESKDALLSPLPSDRRVSQLSMARVSVVSAVSSRISYDYDAAEFQVDDDNEMSDTNRNSGNVYKEYFKHGASIVLLAVLALAVIFSQVVVSGNDMWLSYWTNMEGTRRSLESNISRSSYEHFPRNNPFLGSIFTLDRYGLLTTTDAVYLYTFVILLCIVVVVGRNLYFIWVCSKSNQNLHDTMFSNVLGTSLSFFHRNQSGRIFNRFTKDVGNVDEMLPITMLEAIQVMLVVCGCIVVILICNNWMVIPLLIIGVIFYFLWANGSKIITRLKQLESVAKSPVFAHVNATMEGLSTIKSSGPEVAKLLENQFNQLQDVHGGAWYMLTIATSSISLYIDLLMSIFYTCVAFSFILIDDGTVLSGHVGLALTQSSIILGTLPHGVKQINRMLAFMASVSRLLEYTVLPSEGDWQSSNPPPPSWPQRGLVSLRNVNLRYSLDQPAVLKDLNVKLEPGWKVGVVGRTGAGKSSLISVLFRLFPEGLQGKIEIDGIDASTIGLHELRSKISIIPQQPFLFSNSVRNNLDPFNSYDDAKLWDSLHQVELSHLQVDQMIERSGSNLSIGQRQLICLARAILRNNRILVLDEATANIDNQTDALIQQTIRTKFADCTVITVAHRLNTIIDCDRIIVMDAGRIEEFGCPHELLRNNPNGVFSQMVNNTGPAMARILRQEAEKSYSGSCLPLEEQPSSIDGDNTEIIAQTSRIVKSILKHNHLFEIQGGSTYLLLQARLLVAIAVEFAGNMPLLNGSVGLGYLISATSVIVSIVQSSFDSYFAEDYSFRIQNPLRSSFKRHCCTVTLYVRSIDLISDGIMESKTVYTKRNPKDKAGPLSKLFFAWSWRLMLKGAKTELELPDLYFPPRNNESERLANRLNKSWERELTKLKQEDTASIEMDTAKSKEKNGPSLWAALLRTFRKEFAITGIMMAMNVAVLNPLMASLQAYVISYFDRGNDDIRLIKNEALIYAGGMISLVFLTRFIVHHVAQLQIQLAMKLRIACSSLIYKKILRLSKSALTQTTNGQVANLLSNDLQRFDLFCVYVHFIWISPLQVTSQISLTIKFYKSILRSQLIIIGSLMWTMIGLVTLVGIVALVILPLPMHFITVNVMRKLRQQIARLTDERVQLMQELIAGIQVIKMYAWEKPFSHILTGIRKNEILKIRKCKYIYAGYLSNVVLTARIVLFITLVITVLSGYKLRSDITFTLSAFFEMLQLTMAFLFPLSLIQLSETRVTIDRLQNFLLLDEQCQGTSQDRAVQNGSSRLQKTIQKTNNRWADESLELKNGRKNAPVTRIDDTTPVSVTLDRVYANWVPEQLPPTLSQVSMEIRSGELFAVVGCVGSGKSSILHLLLKELPLRAGTVQVSSGATGNVDSTTHGFIVDKPNLTISYASQDPWLFSGTIRDNILFGQQYDNARYVAVTKACALTKDFQQLPHGDMTSVGENGSALSGGQRARVNLARAVYKQADIYLLDDPLSAVDAKVAKHLFQKCIQQYLHKKTRVLVTHQLQFIEHTDSIAVLDRGMVKMQGSYNELSKSSAKFVSVIKDIKMSVEPVESDRRISQLSMARVSVVSAVSSRMSYDYDAAEFQLDDDNEMSATNRNSGNVYRDYFKQGGSLVLLTVLALAVIFSQVVVSGNDMWLSYWSNVEATRQSLESNISRSSYEHFPRNNTFFGSIFTLDRYGLLTTTDAVYLYTFVILLCIVAVVARNLYFVWVCSKSNQNLYDAMFSNLMGTSLSFFHRNQSGRIFNRFTKDVGNVDEMLPSAMLETIQVMLVVCGCIVVIVICNYWMAIAILIIGVICYFLWASGSKNVTRLKQLESVAKSPVFAHVNATMEGLSTIKTSGPDVTKLLEHQFNQLQDVHGGAWCMLTIATSSISLYIDLLMSIFYTCVAFSFILIDDSTVLSGHVGLALTQSSIILGTLPHGVKQINRMLAFMASVSRLLEYTVLPSEGDWQSSNPPPPSWPQRGLVSLRNVNLRYSLDQPAVLKDLNVKLEPGWKVGVVGRTGAGKSSLISVLFRLFPEGLQGKIEIDGIDASTIGLHELRSKISIIPQQPFLFSNSVRNNLDPFNSYDDAKLWDSLHQVELSHLHLDQMIERSGSNMSIGQRQLICLARAILRNNRILVLDEATANIDNQTDALIQQTIRTRFADCTVITVAHRLNTIIDCDRIIVMDAGRIEEFGCPHELLRDNPDGVFSQMVENTGPTMARMLRQQAEMACAKNVQERNVCLRRESSTDSNKTEIVGITKL
ncbi:uncharacterized protein LOC143214568 [Lasioglossum baleicum]|uniref:uncharacterized protein LOC143214568 n=1 Tax=Lasioglossum baleicum TaxID=434251 RepID=UPI003FCD9D6F